MDADYLQEEYLDISEADWNEYKASKKVLPKKRKNAKRLENFCQEKIEELINAIREQRSIWDLNSKDHCNANALNRSWNLVANAVRKEVNECKIAWKAIMQSHRYRTNAAKKKKSGSSGGTFLSSPSLDDSENQWEFSQHLDFLQETATKRSTFDSMLVASAESENNASESSSDWENQKSYFYGQSKSSSMTNKKNAAILELLEVQKSLIAKQASPEKPHESFWNYLSDLTKDLNIPQMQELQKEMLQLVFDKLEQSNAS